MQGSLKLKTYKSLGLESFYSMVGLAEFGSRLKHETYLKGLYKYSTEPQSDIIEYCLRDFLNRMLGNTDNHGRNQSLLKDELSVTLAPIYDFAPMKFDPEGIVRNTSWQDPIEQGNIKLLTELLVDEYKVSIEKWNQSLCQFTSKCKKLEKLPAKSNVLKYFLSKTKIERDKLMKQLSLYCEHME